MIFLPGDPNFDVNWASQSKDEETLNRARLEYNNKMQQEGMALFICSCCVALELATYASGAFRNRDRQKTWGEPSHKGKSKGIYYN